MFNIYNTGRRGQDFLNFNPFTAQNPALNQPIFNFNSNFSFDMGLFGNSFNMPLNFLNFGPNGLSFSPMGLDFGAMSAGSLFPNFLNFNPSSNSNNNIDYSRNMPSLRQRSGAIPLSKECSRRIDDMARRLNFNPKDLKALIYSESGGNPQAVNPSSGASGLIQFMPATARGMGTSVQAIRRMTAEQQMGLIEKYLRTMKKAAGFQPGHKLTSGELYAIVFMPARAKSQVLCSRGSAAYNSNDGLDKNKDGHITKADLEAHLKQFKSFVSRTKA